MARLIGFVIILIIGFVGYNYYMGEGEDKERAEKIVNEVKGLGSSVKDMFMEEKEKYERGDYDKTLDKVGNFINKLKKNKNNLEESTESEMNSIDKEIKRLQKELRNFDDDDNNAKRRMEKDLKNLVRKANDLVKEVE